MKRVSYLGPEGTVSHESASYFFAGQSSHTLVPYKLISDVFMSTVNHETDYSVIPIENTIDGSVNPHMDLLVHEVDLPIQAEWIYPSIQNIIGYKNIASGNSLVDDLAHVRKIFSMPVAIAQCHTFLRSYLPQAEFVNVTSTAEGVRLVKEHGDETYAAIGTELAAQLYGLDLLAADITDHHNNFTRFILIGREPIIAPPDAKKKTTIILTLPEDYPGALHQVLSAFAWRRINLSKIESRPTKKQLGSYFFYIDIEESMDSILLPAALAEIEALGCQVRMLGSYPTFNYQSQKNNSRM